jgi:hypothetical protein
MVEDEVSTKLSKLEQDLELTKSEIEKIKTSNNNWITKAAVILGVIGALIAIPKGVKDAIEAVNQKPKTSVDLGRPLAIRYDPQKQVLKFDIPMVANNEGNANDLIERLSGKVHAAPDNANSPIVISNIEVSEVGHLLEFPIPIPVRQPKSFSVDLFLNAPFSEQVHRPIKSR